MVLFLTKNGQKTGQILKKVQILTPDEDCLINETRVVSWAKSGSRPTKNRQKRPFLGVFGWNSKSFFVGNFSFSTFWPFFISLGFNLEIWKKAIFIVLKPLEAKKGPKNRYFCHFFGGPEKSTKNRDFEPKSCPYWNRWNHIKPTKSWKIFQVFGYFIDKAKRNLLREPNKYLPPYLAAR